MRTHKTALYVRVPGDKFRPLKITRPTLQQLGARLRIVGRRIALIESRLKEGHEVPPFLVQLKRLRDGIKGYLANIGKERQKDLPKSSNLRIGYREHTKKLAILSAYGAGEKTLAAA
jgi:hypothetical protein